MRDGVRAVAEMSMPRPILVAELLAHVHADQTHPERRGPECLNGKKSSTPRAGSTGAPPRAGPCWIRRAMVAWDWASFVAGDFQT